MRRRNGIRTSSSLVKVISTESANTRKASAVSVEPEDGSSTASMCKGHQVLVDAAGESLTGMTVVGVSRDRPGPDEGISGAT